MAAREVSRFARNSRDWQQLVEMCRVVDTLLIDQETVYAPRQGNDRLLLGLKGSLNEYELDLLRQRSLAARHEKARRGELVVARAGRLHQGRRPAGEGSRPARAGGDPARHRQGRRARQRAPGAALVPRARARPADQGQRRCRWSGAVRAIRPSTSSSPIRPMAAPTPMARPASRLSYDGAGAKARPRRKPRAEWLALKPGAHEGYVDWDRAEAIRKMVSENVPTAGARGAPKHGAALLVGPAALPPLRSEAHRPVHRGQGPDPPLRLRSRAARLRRAELHRLRRPARRRRRRGGAARRRAARRGAGGAGGRGAGERRGATRRARP